VKILYPSFRGDGFNGFLQMRDQIFPLACSPFLNHPFRALEPLRWKTELPSLAGPLQKTAAGSASPTLVLASTAVDFSTVVACGWSSGQPDIWPPSPVLQARAQPPPNHLQGVWRRSGCFFGVCHSQRLFKLHAWEHIFHEDFGQAITGCDTQFVEPPWKALISNKGILPLLWEWFEAHPNLLPAFVDDNPQAPVPKGWVRKPYFSREGANVDIRTEDGRRVLKTGPMAMRPIFCRLLHLCRSSLTVTR